MLAEHVHACFLEFLESFHLPLAASGGGGTAHYVAQAVRMVRSGKRTLWVRLQHLEEADRCSLSFEPSELGKVIADKFASVQDALDAAVTAIVARLDREGLLQGENPRAKTFCEYAVAFPDGPSLSGLGSLGSRTMGGLVALHGAVLQASEVLPELLFGTFACSSCGHTLRGLRQELTCGLPSKCPIRRCGSRMQWRLQDEGSGTQWGDWQRLRLQLPGESGSPRAAPWALTAFVRGDACGGCDPGATVLVTGHLIALPAPSSLASPFQGDHSFAVLGSLVPEGHQQVRNRGKSRGIEDGESHGRPARSDVRLRRALGEAGQPRVPPVPVDHRGLLDRLASAVAPAVAGHRDVKKGLLLMLLGGVHKKTAAGDKLRGNIHACLLGGPATAKSSLLRWVAELAPQSVYASGQSASAAGLTAAVAQEAGGKTLRPGALMQAGSGICCIDDLDLMEDGDRQALYAAMGSEEINLSKAGLHVRLNVGASVLAAFSTMSRSLGLHAPERQDARLPSSIASQFDIVLLLEDKCSAGTDEALARHLFSVVRGAEQGGDGSGLTALRREDLQGHIQHGQTLEPQLSPEADGRLRHCYAELRRLGALPSCGGLASPRHLESLIRLSEAAARAHLQDTVSADHVDEAFELMAGMLRSVHWVPDPTGHIEALARPLKRGNLSAAAPRQRRRH